MKETINNNVVDNYEEHSQHLVVDNKCSTCYNNPPQVMINEEGFIVLEESDSAIRDTYDYDKDDADYHEHKDMN